MFKNKGTSSLEETIGANQHRGVYLLASGNIVGRISQTGTDNRGLGRLPSFSNHQRRYDYSIFPASTSIKDTRDQTSLTQTAMGHRHAKMH
eukprot:4405853-Ditylum_brightwellii.AAC.2